MELKDKIAIKDYLTQKETLIYLGIGQEKLNRFIQDGLPYHHIDERTIWYSKKDIEKYLNRYKKELYPAKKLALYK